MHAFKSYSNQKVSILSYCKMIYMYQTDIGAFHPLWLGKRSAASNTAQHGAARRSLVGFEIGVRSFFDL